VSDEPTSNEREQVERDTHDDPEPGVRQDARGERVPDLPPADGGTSAGAPGSPPETTREHRRHADRLDREERGEQG
jgi:hypothetical protein